MSLERRFSSQLTRFVSQFGFRGKAVQIVSWRLDNQSIVGKLVNNSQLFDFSISDKGLRYELSPEKRSDAWMEGLLFQVICPTLGSHLYSPGFIQGVLHQDAKDCSGSNSLPCGDTCISDKKTCQIDSPEALRISRGLLKVASVLRSPRQAVLTSAKGNTKTPSKASKTALYSNEVEANLLSLEDEIRFNYNESLIAIDPATGKELLRLGGKHAEVAIYGDDLKKLKGAIVTHNHPGTLHDLSMDVHDEAVLGTSFSPDDILTMVKNEVSEMRAVSLGYRHSMQAPSGGWPEDREKFWEEKIVPSYNKHFTLELQKQVDSFRRGEASAETLDARLHHQVWEGVAKDSGLIYKRELIPGNHAQKATEVRKPAIQRRINRRRMANLGLASVAGLAYIALGMLTLAEEERMRANQANATVPGGKPPVRRA